MNTTRRALLLACLLVPPLSAQGCEFPALAIPDDNPAGITDTLTAAGFDLITDLDVGMQITHPSIGELRITLTHVETATTVVLLDRAPCFSPDIDVTFDDEFSHPGTGGCTLIIGAGPALAGTRQSLTALSAFDGEATSGTWELNVTDSSGGNTGTLVGWCLSIDTNGGSCFASGLAIPDNDPAGVADVRFVGSFVFFVEELSVFVDITHPSVGDLELTLTKSGTGISVVLLDQNGCSGQDVFALFDDDSAVPAQASCQGQSPAVPFTVRPVSPLAAFRGLSLAGTWELRVRDLTGSAVGTLNDWCVINGLSGTCPLVLCGDCNGDAGVSVLDALAAAQHAAGLIQLQGTGIANCNVAGAVEPAAGAGVDVLDALLLAQFSAGLGVVLGCC